MDRGITIGNPILYAKGKVKENKWMRQRLLSVQSTVDNKCPTSYLNRRLRRKNLKKEQLNEDRRRTIAQDNTIMLKSISSIMRHNNIDTWASTRKYVPKMSNVHSRLKHQHFINWENKILHGRIMNTTPWISNKEMKMSFEKQLKHLRHMGEYAYKGGGKKNGSFDKYWQRAVFEARPIRKINSRARLEASHLSSCKNNESKRNHLKISSVGNVNEHPMTSKLSQR